MAENDHETINIDGYQYALWPGKRRSGSAVVDLIHDKKRLARIFFSDDYSLPDPKRSDQWGFELHYPAEALPRVIDMLRNEKPCYLIWRGPQETRLSTGPEPVGDGEK
ncbi:MAG: hypothetical protein R3336_08145 [Phycisphaeraceae bacterium]|nr:hypothetical protein [Phycisphaeraceae bacterium]